ncbi:hypothetical protein Pmar_PMAR014084 [Perkinsus marinus ATCC 50983]|uniref:Uncharacterized protein n=1 Tax=Perkinsus marinus (strain ATCC 50983 / TXsc) TaxID=423536 RepID=C5L2U7_PERM5|nr:hypothetical protein Pmar_PMAR014084 [Perkinsus marinus ATCC 50983]EER08920.1 hypothetical protein Pmar_PMAR014084 [Perkinsus marinus ATCC 50983]|eukprot:XP_002777104.1 hypothetical protein Pmar_PMAR014084 [Perkinsus marinus ATCC 50983]
MLGQHVHVEMAWLCDYVHAFRVKLMEFLQCEKEVQLDDSEKAARMGAEMLSYELDDRLRKHNTRKGLVRSEWYEPRLKQIMSHKSKFERHAVAIAKKSAAQDGRFDALMDTLIEGDKRLRATIDELLHRVSQLKPSAESNSRNPEDIMSELKGLSRRARDTGDEFKRVYREVSKEMAALSGPLVEQLIAANSDVTRIQKEQKHEGYSGAEIEFYSAEIAKLDEGLKAKAADRLVQVEELEAAMTNMVERVLEEFEKQRNEVYEEVCIAYGLGKEHVVARRQLREKVHELSELVTEPLSKIVELEEYLSRIITGANSDEVCTPKDQYIT